jgi:predicted anti-sigma-YlaC factor YlaD
VRIADDITCAELVELVTEYLEGALEPTLVERFEEHLVLCDGCSIHVQQMAETIRMTGSLREEDLQPEMAERLLVAFRSWNGALSG